MLETSDLVDQELGLDPPNMKGGNCSAAEAGSYVVDAGAAAVVDSAMVQMKVVEEDAHSVGSARRAAGCSVVMDVAAERMYRNFGTVHC